MEKLLTRNWGIEKSFTLDVYESRDGYKALRKAITMEPKDIVQEVVKSNLRGRGGAGFPCGRKWLFLKSDSTLPKYLVINADEGEPGTFKDREILANDPHSLIEGCIVSSYALGIHTCYIYLRGEFVLQYERIEAAIEEAYKKGYLGENILGSGFDLNIYPHRGAGAYICGEETALLNSLEGRRGEPRLKPPYPAMVGLFDCPTIINNVETIAYIPFIVEHGGKWFSDLGTQYDPSPEGRIPDNDGGLRLYCVSGHVKRPGVYELSTRTTLREIIYEHAGGILDDQELKGVIPGGSSTPILLPSEIDVVMDNVSLKKVKSMAGSAGIIVMRQGTCMVRAALRLAKFYHHESCGQCTPCREGTGWLERILYRIEHGKGKTEDLKTLYEASENMEGNTICPLADAAAWPTKAFLRKYPEEFEAHIAQKACPLH